MSDLMTSAAISVRVREKPHVPVSERLAYPVPEACAIGGFSRAKAYELIKTGELKSVRRAGRRLILRADLEAFLMGEAA